VDSEGLCKCSIALGLLVGLAHGGLSAEVGVLAVLGTLKLLVQLRHLHKMVSCLLLAVAAVAQGQMPPVPNPRRPTPLFSWDTVPIAFHGANRSGIYNGPSSASAL
jgi:hypothetical protein